MFFARCEDVQRSPLSILRPLEIGSCRLQVNVQSIKAEECICNCSLPCWWNSTYLNSMDCFVFCRFEQFPQYVSIPHKSCSLSLWSFRRTRFILMLSGDETLHQGHHLRRFITQHAGFCGGSEDQRSCNVWGFEGAQNKRYIMMSRGYTYSHHNMLVFGYLTWFSQFCWYVAAASFCVTRMESQR